MDINSLGTILSVWAHPDDETYLCAGLMSAAVDADQSVVCVTATRGELGTPDPENYPPETMGKIREAELLACLDILGVRDHRFLDYVDGSCAAVPHAEGVDKIVSLIEQVAPDSVMTFGPEGMTDHADHKAVHRWTVEAFERSAKAGARLYFATLTQEWKDAYYETFQRANVFEGDTPPVTPEADLAIDFVLSDELVARKMTAIKAHTSQVKMLFDMFGETMFREAHTHERYSLGAVKP